MGPRAAAPRPSQGAPRPSQGAPRPSQGAAPPSQGAPRPSRAARGTPGPGALFGLDEEPTCGDVEIWARGQGLTLLIGLDEAGRGPLAGPVVVGACALPDPCPPALVGLNDSKQLTEAQREAFFDPILAHALGVGLAIVEHDVIDEINILRASLHGMAIAWDQLVGAAPHLRASTVLVDGKDRAPLPGDVDQRPLVKGDARSLNIAAASILAKVARDRIMVRAHAEWPVYGFDHHKGYPTLAHRRAIAAHGPCPIHRRSFTLLAPDAPDEPSAADEPGERDP